MNTSHVQYPHRAPGRGRDGGAHTAVRSPATGTRKGDEPVDVLAVNGYLPLRLVLTDTLAVRTSFDPLRVDSEHTIGGRAQRGMLAAALRRAGRERELHDWVARGAQVRFAPAHPRLEPGADPGLPGAAPRAAVAYPAPAYLYTPGKDGDTAVDAFGDTDPATPYRAVRDPLTPDRSLRAAVRTTAEQYLGRPRTGEAARSAPFFTTSVDPGQVFEARWQLRAPDPDALERLAEGIAALLAEADGTLTLGSGGTRAHGGVHVAPVDPDRLLAPDRVDPVHARSWEAGTPVDLLLLSPALLVGADGQARPQALVPAVLDLLARRLPGVRAHVLASHVEAGLVGAYHRGYQGPMAQRWAARPGAVVRLRLDRDLTTDQARDLEAHPLGERVVDGHGQFTLLSPPPPGPEPLAPVAVPLAGRVPGTVPLADGRAVPVGEPPLPERDGPLRSLYDELLWNAAVEPVRDHARALARASAHRLDPLTPHLLGRLREATVHPHPTPENALAALERTVTAPSTGRTATGSADAHKAPYDRAVRALARARLVRPGGREPVTVQSWLEGLSARTSAAWWSDNRPDPVYSPAYARAIAAVDLSLPDGLPPDDHPSALSARAREWEGRAAPRLALTLVSSWLAEAARALRAEQDGGRPGGGGAG
ncbi:hypothetical protein HNR06_000328 [Nocardiopsis arvandica]|uniref:Uncharacterized protein n=1 Tax=Nocardiopsis sinuspersici TaxID=501010 RepID=A0A7Y9X7Q7_9ACTN|nr:hypothetical protein [Nocardiopsis sinuspersici]NYH50739.1 hypothetical protein [Nocardiopsis sinuspersici]